jgi:hypothetical protein
MMRFISIGYQISDCDMFSFYDTVSGNYKRFAGSQVWESADKFKEDFNAEIGDTRHVEGQVTYIKRQLERYLELIPEKFKNP